MGEKNLLNKDQKGQVTIFIILALVIVVLGILSYAFYPQLKANFELDIKNPTEFIQICMEEEIENNIVEISSQGGSLNPEHYFLYKDEKLEYLCYTRENYIPCIMQQPFLKEHVENELKESLKDTAKGCFESLEKNYKKQGYDTNLNLGDMNVQLLPEKVMVILDNTLTLTKESSDRYTDFSIVVNNNLYELVSIAKSILSFETRYGDSETTIYMDFYHDLKVEKKKQSDGTTIYILTNRDNGNKFQFASRSLAWPPGYSI